MSSSFAVPIASNAFHSHHSHGHSRSQHRRPGTERLPVPFALPRIPSERLYPKSEDGKHSPEKDPNTFSLSNQRRFHANESLSIPAPLQNDSLGPKSGDMDILPLSHPSPGYMPAEAYGFPTVHGKMKEDLPSSTDALSSSQKSSNEIATAFLLPLPFIMTLLVRTSPDDVALQLPDGESVASLSSDFATTCLLTSISLMLLAACGKLLGLEASGHYRKTSAVGLDIARNILVRMVSVGLPLYASLKLSGVRIAMIYVVLATSGLLQSSDLTRSGMRLPELKKFASSRIWILAFLVAGIVVDCAGLSLRARRTSLLSGYLTLLCSIFIIDAPYFSRSSPKSSNATSPPSAKSKSAVAATPLNVEQSPDSVQITSRQVSSNLADELTLNLLSGIVLGGFTFLMSWVWISPPSGAAFWLAAGATSTSAAFSFAYCDPSSLRPPGKLGFGLAMTLTLVATLVTPLDSIWAMLTEAATAGFGILAVHLDNKQASEFHSAHHSHHHGHHDEGRHSRVTRFLLHLSEGYPLMHSILAERDSRRIFYFMCLNFGFMLVQLAYGIITGSLGLLSDSIHMFFDCLALVVGLCAAVMSKWPPSVRFPYGYGKVDTLAGFANGVFLMIISIELVYEALERLSEGFEMKRLSELLTVSALGLGVNLIGIMAFDHAHHGHGHSHAGHDHGSHSHGHEDDTSSHLGHHHSNENMYGIYLHILADTMGSVAVVISTFLIQWFGWPGFDPLASCLIAILIFMSAIPLVKSSAKTLLLSIPEEVEYGMRETLSGVSEIRGVVGYTVPKFWLDDIGPPAHGQHDHDHGDHHHDEHHHDHSHSTQNHHHHHHHHEQCSSNGSKILGVMHVIASKGADLDEVRERVVQYLKGRDMDVVVQVERDGDSKCWCRSGIKSG